MKVVHYINQFFAGIGGEEKADIEPYITKELIGPSILLDELLKKDTKGEVVATIVCGDSYYGSNIQEAQNRILDLIKDIDFDLFIAGPAFRAGRYGVACGDICKAVSDSRKVLTVTSMDSENPGVEMYKQFTYMMPGGGSAASMRKDMKNILEIGYKIYNSEEPIPASELGIFLRGKRHQVINGHNVPASTRAVDMILAKVLDKKFETELPIPKNDMVEIQTLNKPLKDSKIAFVTSGGIVPVDNPDRIQSASATRWGMYDISNMEKLESGVFKTIHAGFDPMAANEDPNKIVPIDILRELEKEGYIGKVDSHFYSTVGTGTTENEAKRMGLEIAEVLKEHGVDAVLLSST